MKINKFELERYFSLYEFSVKYQFSPSDCQALSLRYLLSLAHEKTLNEWTELKLGYTESNGNPRLRNKISQLYKNVLKDQVITCVPEEGIFIAMNSILDSDDHVIVLTPIYQSLIEVPRSIGAVLSFWDLQEKEGDWFLDLNQLDQLKKTNTKMLIINFPHNPTGFLPSLKDLEYMVSWARKNNVIIFSDEMYRGLEFNNKIQLPSLVEIYEKSVVLSGLSKSYGLPGLRMGWLISRNKEEINLFQRFKDYTTICGTGPSEILSEIAIDNKDQIVSTNQKRIRNNYNALLAAFDQMNISRRFLNLQGGSVLFPKLEKGNIKNFCQYCLNNHELMILPSFVFLYDKEHYRIGLGRSDFQNVLEVFKKAYKLFFRNGLSLCQ